MRLTIHTDYGLRFLTYAALKSPEAVSVSDVAARFGISPHHVMKVAQSLAKNGWLESVRGRSGGFKLRFDASQMRIGQVVKTIESDLGIVECMRPQTVKAAPCPITPSCRLPLLLRQATDSFLSVLDRCTIADLVSQNDDLIRNLEVAS